MKAVTFVTQKGGSGKSTLCINLAIAAQEAGASVCILEMDRQATISDWAEHRVSETPEVAQIEAPQLDQIMATLRGSAYDFAFIDTPGVDSPGTLAAIRASDLCIVPCRPTPADLRAFKPTLAAIYRLEKRFAFVLNQTPARSYRIRDAADGLSVLGILPDVNIVSRTDYQDALGIGQGVTEHIRKAPRRPRSGSSGVGSPSGSRRTPPGGGPVQGRARRPKTGKGALTSALRE